MDKGSSTGSINLLTVPSPCSCTDHGDIICQMLVTGRCWPHKQMKKHDCHRHGQTCLCLLCHTNMTDIHDSILCHNVRLSAMSRQTLGWLAENTPVQAAVKSSQNGQVVLGRRWSRKSSMLGRVCRGRWVVQEVLHKVQQQAHSTAKARQCHLH